MVNLPEYEFYNEKTFDPKSNCPIVIKSGEFKDIVFRYGKISLSELENEQLKVTMDIEIINGPKGFDKNQQNFTDTVGEIFVSLVETRTELEKESIDLEADVHEDPLDTK